MKKVLIIDDDRMMLRLAERILSQRYDTITADSGKEALDIFEKERPDLILSDLIMPEMTGFEFHEILKKRYDTEVPVIFMTADGSEDVEGRGFDHGASDFIRKPFHPEALLRRVAHIIDNRDKIHSLELEASTDKLTGMLNKSSAEKLCASMCRERSGMLIILDLDSFKLINDIYGHEKGDTILREFSAVVKSQLSPDDAAGRLGGDEFLIFCCSMRTSAELSEMTELLNRRFDELIDRFLDNDRSIPLGVSAGGVLVPDDGSEFSELFRLADKALYSVKQNGKHGSALYSEIYSSSGGRRDLKSICKLFEERTVLDGAYRIGLDAFMQVYHYFIRYIQSYCHNAYRLLFTLSSDGSNGYRLNTVSEAFAESVSRSLRKSDIFVQLSEDQFFLLIPEITEEPLERLVERIIMNWQTSDLSEGVKVQYESERIPTNKSAHTSRSGDPES